MEDKFFIQAVFLSHSLLVAGHIDRDVFFVILSKLMEDYSK